MNEKDRNIIETSLDKELESLEIVLTAKATRTAITLNEFIDLSLAQGIDPDVLEESLLKDLKEGGRIFGEFRNSIRATVGGSIGRTRDGAQLAMIGVDTKYRWSAVLINTCPDCLERHGQVMKWGEWEAEGLPRSGVTVCGQNCKCVLLPEIASEISPIMRGR
jgi:hypothetical protein